MIAADITGDAAAIIGSALLILAWAIDMLGRRRLR